MSVLYPGLWDEFLCAGQCSLSYESLSYIFRELELLIALPFANVILEAILTRADSKCLVLQLHRNRCATSLVVVVVDCSLLPP